METETNVNSMIATKKTFTDGGKPMARFTMRVMFKPEFQRANQTTGEMYSFWTYRGDLELNKLAKRGLEKKNQLECLGYILKKYANRFLEVVIYDNAKNEAEQILVEIHDGKVVVPSCEERILKFNKWLKEI